MKVLLLGDEEKVKYHPFQKIYTLLRPALEDIGSVTAWTQDREVIKNGLKNYDVFLNYADAPGEHLNSEMLKGLTEFIGNGGGYIALHCGVLFNNPEYGSLVGGKFIEHPPLQELEIEIKKTGHPLTEGLTDFTIEDELYMMELVKPELLQIHMDCRFQGRCYPMAWTKQHNNGRIVFQALGHSPTSFEHPMLVRAVTNSILWAGKRS